MYRDLKRINRGMGKEEGTKFSFHRDTIHPYIPTSGLTQAAIQDFSNSRFSQSPY